MSYTEQLNLFDSKSKVSFEFLLFLKVVHPTDNYIWWKKK